MSGKLALRTLCMALGVIVVTACQHAPVDHAQSQAEAATNSSNTVSIPYEKYTLENYRNTARRSFRPACSR